MTISAYELSEVDRLIAGKQALPPDRIYGWLNTQLSVARHYGGCSFQGHQYYIAHGETGQPLIRSDVLKAEQKANKNKRRNDAVKAEKKAAKNAQEVMF